MLMLTLDDAVAVCMRLLHETTYFDDMSVEEYKGMQEVIRGEFEQTRPKVITCKDCKHKGTKNCVANAWTTIFGVTVKDDFYCGLAERRTDE